MTIYAALDKWIVSDRKIHCSFSDEKEAKEFKDAAEFAFKHGGGQLYSDNKDTKEWNNKYQLMIKQ